MGATSGRRWRRATVGVGLLALSGAGTVGVFGAPAAVAQDAEEQPVEIEGSTLYVAPMTDAVPSIATSSVPPEAVCLVLAAQEIPVCGEHTEDVRFGARDALNTGLQSTRDVPIQPVPPDTAAVSYFGGHPRYQTAVLLPTPEVPEGQELLSYQVSFEQTQPSYDLNSPLFRRTVFGVFASIGPQDPSIFVEEFSRALQEEDAVQPDGGAIGIEACPLLDEFEPEGAPQASDHREMPTREEDGKPVPDVDCILGSGGVYDESTGRWVFDLAFAGNAWASGDLENHGVLLRPTGAPNLAFGDPDTSTNAQVVVDLTTVTASTMTAEAFDPDAMPTIDFGEGDGFEDEPFVEDELAFEEDLGGAPGFDDGAGDLGVDDAPSFDGPEVADDVPAGPETAPDDMSAQAIGQPAGQDGASPGWWVWLLVPAFLGGAYLTSTALLAPATVGGASHAGAFSRLLARAGSTPPARV